VPSVPKEEVTVPPRFGSTRPFENLIKAPHGSMMVPQPLGPRSPGATPLAPLGLLRGQRTKTGRRGKPVQRGSDGALTFLAQPGGLRAPFRGLRRAPSCTPSRSGLLTRGEPAGPLGTPNAASAASRDARAVLRGHALQKVRLRQIREAGGRCQWCGRSGVALVLHHLGELADYRSTLVLCERCHGRQHRSRDP
jgi:hypothetical protein